jgi:hypothetical protein
MSEGQKVIKPLNMFNNIYQFAPPGRGATGPNPYKARVPHLAFGFVGAALAAVTIAVSVILPAGVDSGGHRPPLQLASQAIPAASTGAGAVMSVTVVAAREPGSATGSLRRVGAASRAAPSGETTPSAILRISTAAR